MTKVRRIDGVTFLYALPEGADWRLTPDGRIIVAAPDRPPEIIELDGTSNVLLVDAAKSDVRLK